MGGLLYIWWLSLCFTLLLFAGLFGVTDQFSALAGKAGPAKN
jgi:hypothetical protein